MTRKSYSGSAQHNFVYETSGQKVDLRTQLFQMEPCCQRDNCPNCQNITNAPSDVFHLRSGKSTLEDSIRLCKKSLAQLDGLKADIRLEPAHQNHFLLNFTAQGAVGREDSYKTNLRWSIHCAPQHKMKPILVRALKSNRR
jgi:hypothetical protein